MRATAPLVGLLLLCAPARVGAGEETSSAAREALRRAVETTLDPDVDPCRDFYRFACGGWLASIRPREGESRWSRGYSTRRSEIRATLDALLHQAMRGGAGDDASARAVGDFYAACLDMDRVEALGLAPLAPWLERIDEVHDLVGAFAVAAELGDLGAAPFFALAPAADPADPRIEGVRIVSGGSALPSPKLYLDDDRPTRRLRAAYRRHVAAMLERTGLDAGEARRSAHEIVELEAALARSDALAPGAASMTVAVSSGLPWDAYFSAAGRPELRALARVDPRFAASLARLLAAASPATLRSYLRWHAVHAVAPLLPRTLVAEDFRFFGRELAGRATPPSRAESCRSLTSRSLPDELGQLYRRASLSEPARAAAEATVAAVGAAFSAHLSELPWLDAGAAGPAAARLSEVELRVGRSADGTSPAPPPFDRRRLFENVVATRHRERRERLDRVGRPFAAAPPLVAPFELDALWDPLALALEVPAGWLAPPFFAPELPLPMRFGVLGALAGHELAHALDALAPRPDDGGAAARRREAEACLSSQVSELEAAPGLQADGRSALSESFADAVGLAAAYDAYRRSAAARAPDEPLVPALGDDRLFFVAWAQSWCTFTTPDALALQVREDTHAPASVRVTAALLNSRDFRRAFRCEGGDPMAPVPACTLW